MVDPLHDWSLGDVLREHARSRPNLTAVVDGDVRLTFFELDSRVDRLASVLADAGLGPGEVTLWYGQNSHRVLELLLAAARLGAVVCPANWRLSVEELNFVVQDLSPRVVVWQNVEVGDIARQARHDSPESTWIQHDGTNPDDYEGRLDRTAPAPEPVAADPRAEVLLLYTAAFEGRPNAAALSHEALLHQALIVALAARIDESAVYLNSGPLFHIATWMWALATFVLGGTNVYVPRVDAEELCRLIEAERCTGAFLMPPTIEEIVAVNRDHRFDLSSLRASAGPAAWSEMITVDTSPLAAHRGGYGQTEASGLATFAALAPSATGRAGRPAPFVQLRIIDPDDADVPPGETGEIVLRGPTIATEYRNRPELTRERRRSGWHHTFDLGRREADGSITFVGPMTRIIKSAAENIYPAEVESAIKAHPAVADCAVIGVPDATWGQCVKALVVLDEDVPDGDVDAESIIAHCRARIASYKKPSVVVFVEALPRTHGQLDYDALDATHGGGGYPGLEGPPSGPSKEIE